MAMKHTPNGSCIMNRMYGTVKKRRHLKVRASSKLFPRIKTAAPPDLEGAAVFSYLKILMLTPS